MSKLISIKEGGTGRKFKASELEIDLQDGGTSGWVPYDELPLEYIFINENGTYRPQKYGFSDVTVSIPQFLKGFDPETLELTLITLDPISFDILEVIVPSNFPDLELVPFTIGFDPLDDLHFITIDPVTGDLIDIDLPDNFGNFPDFLAGTEPEIIIGYDTGEDEYKIILADDGELTVTDFPYDFVNPDGTSISTPDVQDLDITDSGYLFGIDPDTGTCELVTFDGEDVTVIDLPYDFDTYDFDESGVMTGFDGDGNEVDVFFDNDTKQVTVSNLPTSIVIIVQPDKTTYEEGEVISIIGMVVVAKNDDGSTWTNQDYPNGHIPLGELRTSQIDVSTSVEFPDYTTTGQLSTSNATKMFKESLEYAFVNCVKPDSEVWIDYPPIVERLLSEFPGKRYLLVGIVAKTGGAINTTFWNPFYETMRLYISDEINDDYIYLDRRYPCTMFEVWCSHNAGSLTIDTLVSNKGKTTAVIYAGIKNDNEYSSLGAGGIRTEDVTVMWNRPVDKEELTTSFEISVVIPVESEG